MTALSAKIADDGRKAGSLTRDDIDRSLRDYCKLYGPSFTSAAFNPATAKWQDRPDLVDRYYVGNTLRDGRPWPSLNSIRRAYGTFSAARLAIGLPANTPGPARGRREAGKHRPIRDMRIERVEVLSDRDRELAAQLRQAEHRLFRAEQRLEAARKRAERAEARTPRAAPRAITKTKTKTKTVKVRDERALERLRAKLADRDARLVAVEDQLKMANREVDGLKKVMLREQARASDALSEAALAVQEVNEAQKVANRASDRLEAAEARTERLKADLESAQEQILGVSEAAAAHELVRQAEVRVERAETVAARAEREMAEQAAAITGEHRKLTKAELDALRRNGPAGPSVMRDALERLARARTRNAGDLDAALVEVASAAIGWRDVERR